jgi:glycosyltransferase involved in cell wall biosynthesis
VAEPVVLVAGGDPRPPSKTLAEAGVPGIGGHSTYVRAHALAVRRAGFEPNIVCIGPRRQTVETDVGVLHWTPLDWEPEWLARNRRHLLIWRFLVLARATEAFVHAHPRVRLLHGFGVYGSSAVLASRALRRQGLATVAVASAYDTMAREARAKLCGVSPDHGSLPRIRLVAELLWTRLVVDRWERRGYVGAQQVLVNYESVRQLLATSYGLGETIRKIPYSSDAAFRETDVPPALPAALALRGPASTPLVVAMSRHDPRKGVDVLLRALGQLRAAGVPFRVCLIGTGPLLAAHRRLAERLGLGGAVIEGFVPDAYPYVHHADVFALPSLEEGSGSLALLEALQAGVSVVASAVDGVPEDVADGENALLVPPGDVAALRDGLAAVLTDLALRRRLGAAARRTFERRFSADVFTAALAGAYADLGVSP